MTDLLDIRPEVAAALAEGRPVVALETTALAHGLPPPQNLVTARAMARAVRAAGAVPATIGLIGGRVRVGLDGAELARFADPDDQAAKVSHRDLGPVLAAGGLGATTVAATLACAARAGIRLLATGGIGGVHRNGLPGGPDRLDVSADLTELARAPVAVVCAGAKAILDLPRTLEVLETRGVPVLGYGCDDFPAFYARRSGLRLAARVDTPMAAAAALRAHWRLGLPGGLVIAVPPPAATALDVEELEAWIGQALVAAAQGVVGQAVTPFLLARLAALSAGRTLAANTALLEHNARIGGEIATALEQHPTLRGHLMGQSGSFGQARRAARCGSSGKRRNAADEPLWPTEGRVLLSRGRVALLIRCPASHFEALLTTGQNNPGQMTL